VSCVTHTCQRRAVQTYCSERRENSNGVTHDTLSTRRSKNGDENHSLSWCCDAGSRCPQVHTNVLICLHCTIPQQAHDNTTTGCRRLIRSPKLQIIFHNRATRYRSLFRKMTYKDKGSCESSPPCTHCKTCVSAHKCRHMYVCRQVQTNVQATSAGHKCRQ